MKMLVLLIILPITCVCQDNIPKAIPANQQSYLYHVFKDNCIGENPAAIISPKVFYVYDFDSCKSAYFSHIFFKVAYRKNYYLIREDDIINSKDLIKQLLQLSSDQRLRLMGVVYDSTIHEDSILSVQEGYRIIKNNKLLAQRIKAVPFALLDYSIYDESEVTKGTGIKFALFNSGTKTIKYIWFSVTGINPVGDAVSSKVLKGVGPIYSFDSGIYEFNYTWFTDIVESAKVNYIKVQYEDGSAKTISNPKVFRF